jgi:hypothetical protein
MERTVMKMFIESSRLIKRTANGSEIWSLQLTQVAGAGLSTNSLQLYPEVNRARTRWHGTVCLLLLIATLGGAVALGERLAAEDRAGSEGMVGTVGR